MVFNLENNLGNPKKLFLFKFLSMIIILVILFVLNLFLSKNQWENLGIVLKSFFIFVGVPLLILMIFLSYRNIKKNGINGNDASVLSLIPGFGQYICGYRIKGLIIFLIFWGCFNQF